jgi:hypothetical protein
LAKCRSREMLSQPFCFTSEDYEREAEKPMKGGSDDGKIMRLRRHYWHRARDCSIHVATHLQRSVRQRLICHLSNRG